MATMPEEFTINVKLKVPELKLMSTEALVEIHSQIEAELTERHNKFVDENSVRAMRLRDAAR